MRCAFLTMENTSGWSIDADLAFVPLAELGWQAEWLPWRRRGVRWDDFDAAYLAATWDYPEDPSAFLTVLEEIEVSAAVLVNPLALVRWNLPKTYLRELEAGGVPIVPSRWHERYGDCRLEDEVAVLGAERIVVKPVVSTNAKDTFLLRPPELRDAVPALARTFAARPFVVQPFLDSVQTEGEYSLFYIGGGFSHGIRKVPAAEDFRVQEEHGADIRPLQPTDELVAAGTQAVELLEPAPLYARCDFVRDAEGVLRLMELELIEPSLYLRMHQGAPRRFAIALDAYVRERRTGRT